MGSKEEPEKKRRHVSSTVSPPPKRHAVPPPEEKKADTAELQYENHKLAQQLDVQRNEIYVLETKIKDFKQKQISDDDSLASIQDSWEELEDELELLSARVNAQTDGLKVFKSSYDPKEVVEGPIVPEEIFLQRFLHSGSVSSNGNCNGSLTIERALEQRQAFTIELIENLLQAIETEHAKKDHMFSMVEVDFSPEEYGQQLDIIFEDMRAEIKTLNFAVESLDKKHDNLISDIKVCKGYHDKNQVHLSRLKGELEETLVDLETSRRKLAAMRNQKDALHANAPISGQKEAVSKEYKELEAALEEAKNIATRRLEELKEVQQEKLQISREIRKLQELMSDENHILSSAPYISLLQEAESLQSELECCQSLVEEAQAEYEKCVHHENEALLKMEAKEASEKVNCILKVRLAELEIHLQQYLAEKVELQARLEKASHSSESKDEVAQCKIVVSSLHKEMRMMQQQLNEHKQAACGSYSLRAAAKSLTEVLERKTKECKILADQVAEQSSAINSMKEQVRLLRESEEELKLIIDMYGRESTDSREVRELKQAECRAWAQVERLKTAIDEHRLELKVKEAIEAEAACQQKLATAEAEIAELRQKLEASDREIADGKDVLRLKNEEGDAYLAEIETIGQAYEDMQTQNQRLLQQISERDDYNLKLIFESFKTKQGYASCDEERQLLTNRLKHINNLGEFYKQRAIRLEDQVRIYSEQVVNAMDENRQHINALEQAKRKFMDTEQELGNLKLSIDVAHKELEKQRSKMTVIEAELEKERFERKRVQEELTILNIRASRMNASNDNGHLVEKLQDEINEYKAILKCSVCNNRSKEVVITKCFHLFCGPCIQRNLETRHRKCPTCGVMFAQNDVRNVYI